VCPFEFVPVAAQHMMHYATSLFFAGANFSIFINYYDWIKEWHQYCDFSLKNKRSDGFKTAAD
jgi:hypothetical protein